LMHTSILRKFQFILYHMPARLCNAMQKYLRNSTFSLHCVADTFVWGKWFKIYTANSWWRYRAEICAHTLAENQFTRQPSHFQLETMFMVIQ
jgi:hypothetical protein